MYKIVVLGEVYKCGFNSMTSALEYADLKIHSIDFTIEGY